MSPERKQLIEEARKHRDAWMRYARDLRWDGIIPGGAVYTAQTWHKRMMLAIRTQRR